MTTTTLSQPSLLEESQESGWQLAPTYILQTLELFNWGGFGGMHKADIDAQGSAIIGPTGSGKTTLVDALMTLLTANPKYNLASTGGHESDRDLVSYVRGVSGPGDGGEGRSHIARPGKTVTGLVATLSNGDSLVRIGALLWFDSTSMSPSDMKKLWLFSTAPEHTLQRWLTLQQEGGMRALRQQDKTDTGIWTYPSKKGFLARLRDFFEVRDNAFNLLNRAAGLKQLNSIDEIFRELVLDDNAQFQRAREVADSFDDLTAIHEELEIARRQQRSLEPISTGWEKYQRNQTQLDDQETLSRVLPVWFGEQAHRLWKGEVERLQQRSQQAEAELVTAEEQHAHQLQSCERLNEAYLRLGGADIQTLEALVREKHANLERCQRHAAEYQRLAHYLAFDDGIGREAVATNQMLAAEQLQHAQQALEAAKQAAFEQGSQRYQIEREGRELQDELAEVKARPGSNIPGRFQQFRALLADALELTEDDLPFVAELVQVKESEQAWRGAIERAIGSHRLRILVPPDVSRQALSWINSRHNALHVRIFEVAPAQGQARFFEDGFTRKLDYKEHPYRDALKKLLAGLDRHCVASPEALRETPHAMTVEGLVSGKARFFDKQDQKRLSDDWQTGFDNRDRLAALSAQITQVQERLHSAKAAEQQAKAAQFELEQQVVSLTSLVELDYAQINTPHAEREWQQQRDKLAALTAPDSEAASAKRQWEEARVALEERERQKQHAMKNSLQLNNRLEAAQKEQKSAFRRAEAGLKEAERTLANTHFSALDLQQLANVDELERQAAAELQQQLTTLRATQSRLEKELVKAMSDAKQQDRGALSEVGRELDDVPDYLARLKVLTDEALPEKQKRFQAYLTDSSDQGVSQLLATIDGEVERIEERLEDLNNTLQRVDFQRGRYLQLVANKVVHENLRTFTRANTALASSRFVEDGGESQYKALQHIITLLRDACERQRTLGARALLDPRFRLEFKVAVIDRADGHVIEIRSGSQGGSGGEKEIIASYVLTASLSYALCPDGSARPLFGTIVLDEAFSRSSNAVAGRIIAALKEFHLHALFITPNKEMRLLRKHTRSAVVVHRRGTASSLTPISWQALDTARESRRQRQDENPG